MDFWAHFGPSFNAIELALAPKTLVMNHLRGSHGITSTLEYERRWNGAESKGNQDAAPAKTEVLRSQEPKTRETNVAIAKPGWQFNSKSTTIKKNSLIAVYKQAYS